MEEICPLDWLVSICHFTGASEKQRLKTIWADSLIRFNKYGSHFFKAFLSTLLIEVILGNPRLTYSVYVVNKVLLLVRLALSHYCTWAAVWGDECALMWTILRSSTLGAVICSMSANNWMISFDLFGLCAVIISLRLFSPPQHVSSLEVVQPASPPRSTSTAAGVTGSTGELCQ